MKHEDGFLNGVRGSKIYYQCWLPEDEPRAVLFVVHGLAEHSGRYMNLVNHFVPLGYAVYSLDHPGHGKSDGSRVYVQQFEDFIHTLELYFEMIKEWQPGKAVFLFGHSMGGLIATIYLLDHQQDFKGAIISGPGVKVPDNISGFTVFMGKILSVLLPKAGIIQLDASAISRDKTVVEAYLNDPLVYTGKTTARLAAEMLKAMQRVSGEADKINLPLLIVQGGADKLVDPAGARMLHELAGSKDKALNIYEGFYHEVLNEPQKERVLADIQTWMESHLAL